MTESKWIEFVFKLDTGKTKVYFVKSKEGGGWLGEVKWYGPWRKYAFFPNVNTLFEKTCMQDITNFLTFLMEERKIKTRNL